MTKTPKSHKKTVIGLSAFALAMLGAGFSFKPLYKKFCQVTGFGGTIQVAERASMQVLEREILVRFDANTAPELPWEFKPEVPSVRVKLGQNVLAHYTATNMSAAPIVGTATYNVAPVKAGPFFSKLECFCFTEQRLEPGESVKMPVLFFVDPLMEESTRMSEVKTITLSYTFHAVKTPSEGEVFSTVDREHRLQDLEKFGIEGSKT